MSGQVRVDYALSWRQLEFAWRDAGAERYPGLDCHGGGDISPLTYVRGRSVWSREKPVIRAATDVGAVGVTGPA